MRNVPKNIQLTTRWFLIIGVLTGLLFSSGEGIQLFPFPANSETGKEISLQSENDKSEFYSDSVRNSASPAALKSKEQKNLKFSDHSGSGSMFSEFQMPRLSLAAQVRSCRQQISFSSPFFTATPSDRAPPVI